VVVGNIRVGTPKRLNTEKTSSMKLRPRVICGSLLDLMSENMRAMRTADMRYPPTY